MDCLFNRVTLSCSACSILVWFCSLLFFRESFLCSIRRLFCSTYLHKHKHPRVTIFDMTVKTGQEVTGIRAGNKTENTKHRKIQKSKKSNLKWEHWIKSWPLVLIDELADLAVLLLNAGTFLKNLFLQTFILLKKWSHVTCRSTKYFNFLKYIILIDCLFLQLFICFPFAFLQLIIRL